MSWNEFKSKLINAARDELWAQWTALGVGSTERFVPTRVDLEALLLGTWSFGRTDPRLFDEALSWCYRFGEVVNHKRLEKLLDEHSDPAMQRIAGAWRDTVDERGNINWRLKVDSASTPNSPENVFLTEQLHPQSTGTRRDAIFEHWGLHRGKFTPGDKARTPDLSDPSMAQLFSRKFIGGGGRAELFAILLHGVEATTTELADMAVYSRRLVQDILGDLNDAGVLDWNPGKGRTTRPTLRRDAQNSFRAAMTLKTNTHNWHGLYRQRDWPGFFLGLHSLWQATLRITQSGLDGFKAQSLLRDALEEATKYHGRTTLHAVYRPRLAADNLAGLLQEARTYLNSLFAEEIRVDADRSRSAGSSA